MYSIEDVNLTASSYDVKIETFTFVNEDKALVRSIRKLGAFCKDVESFHKTYVPLVHGIDSLLITLKYDYVTENNGTHVNASFVLNIGCIYISCGGVLKVDLESIKQDITAMFEFRYDVVAKQVY
ncbi:MAG: hypothetical protein JKY22_00350 [Flavobacteriaceae bacterium]|nr:hypothetical protein [Flavobacteriaceae bacterium]PCJ29012.1 MAG: hypothetical protein COA94_02930 [Rickettsiales bacterium]